MSQVRIYQTTLFLFIQPVLHSCSHKKLFSRILTERGDFRQHRLYFAGKQCDVVQNDFSFFIPQIFWNAGCQLVALNYQTLGIGISHSTLGADKVGSIQGDLVNHKTVLRLI